jgi:hypothetical protein
MQLGMRDDEAFGDAAGSEGDASSDWELAAGPYTCLWNVSARQRMKARARLLDLGEATATTEELYSLDIGKLVDAFETALLAVCAHRGLAGARGDVLEIAFDPGER